MKYKYDFAVNALEDQIDILKSFLKKKMPQHKRDGIMGVIVELKSAIKRLESEDDWHNGPSEKPHGKT